MYKILKFDQKKKSPMKNEKYSLIGDWTGDSSYYITDPIYFRKKMRRKTIKEMWFVYFQFYKNDWTQYLEWHLATRQRFAAAGTGIGFRRLLQTHAENCSTAWTLYPFSAMGFWTGMRRKLYINSSTSQ